MIIPTGDSLCCAGEYEDRDLLGYDAIGADCC
jgi:hypothetical protein